MSQTKCLRDQTRRLQRVEYIYVNLLFLRNALSGPFLVSSTAEVPVVQDDATLTAHDQITEGRIGVLAPKPP